MRSFIGINFSKEVKEDISRIQRQVRDHSIKGRFKHVDNFHITLKFLGEIDSRQKEKIPALLEKIAGKHPPFELHLKDIGCFKGRDVIRTLYIAMGGTVDMLKLLNRDTEEAMESLGFVRETRPYTPHITIAQDLTLRLPFEELKKHIDISQTKKIYVSKIELIKSEQIQNKRIYTPICGFELKPQ